jgi:hypothetical protein
MEYIKGSEWRRWDIHLHTPDTKKCDNFTAIENSTKWDTFYADILTYIADGKDPQTAIAAVGITDYFSIENYEKVIADNRLKDAIPFIFPNVELRMQPHTGEAYINIHCLFNPTYIEEVRNYFFPNIKMQKADREYSITRADLIALGKKLHTTANIEDNAAIKKAIEDYSITFDKLKEVFDKNIELRENTIILVSNKSTDGVSAINNPTATASFVSDLQGLRDDIYKFVDGVLSANPDDTNYFLGKKIGCSKETVINRCGSLKPCLHGSDAHKNIEIFEPLNDNDIPTKRYCWIKADPTFNGLKQVVYEPEERIRIDETKPEQKNDYQVIDKVIINNTDFQQEEIVFNQNLTCIIGGRSTGKSILLRAMANCIDSKQVAEKNEKIALKFTPYIFTGMSVYWRDDDKASNAQRKITYIPQTYLNRLSDDQEKKTEIDELIENIILRDTDIRNTNDNLKNKIREIKNDINKTISDLTAKEEEIIELTNAIAEIGKAEDIEKQLKKLEKKRSDIAETNNYTEKDIADFNTAKNKIIEIDNQLQLLNTDKNTIENIKSLLYSSVENIKLTNDYFEKIKEEVNTELEIAKKSWETRRTKILSELNNIIQSQITTKKQNEDVVNKLKDKIESSETLIILNEQIYAEQKRLSQVKTLLEQERTQKETKKKIINKLIALSGKYKSENETFASNLMRRFTDNNQQFSVQAFFKTEDFYNELNKVFNKNILKSNELDDESKANYLSYDFDDGRKGKFINDAFTMPKAIKTKLTIEDALRAILANYYNVSYGAIIGNDTEISQMSPGKKALLLLKLLIDLDDSTNPILIDQPEDDLDNKSIYTDLVSFIKEKKKKRQIILVTHNANIAIGCDSEEIIIANQNGEDAKNSSKKFEYRSGSIENTEPRKDNNGNIIKGILNQTGIQQQSCNILEGGKEAFDLRNNKYVKSQS